MRRLLLMFVFLIFASLAKALVEPQNYNFSLDQLAVFNPGTPVADIEKKFGKGETILIGDSKVLRFLVAYPRYKFPVFVSVHKDKSVDFYAKLPSYFSHDIFHQSLINRHGKQTEFFKSEHSALYMWKNKDNLNHIYSGTCTITCFPLYYTVTYAVAPKEISGFVPLYKQFEKPTPLTGQ